MSWLNWFKRALAGPTAISNAYRDTDAYDVLTQHGSGAITRTKALNYAAVWRACSLLSGDVAKTPLLVLRKMKAGGKERLSSHPAWNLIRKRPHPFYNAFTFKRTVAFHAIMHGNAYILVDYDGRGAPRALMILDPQYTRPVIRNGELMYEAYLDDNRVLHEFDSSRIIHVKGLSGDGLVGYSVLTVAAESLGLGLAAMQYGSNFYKNGARPGTVIEHPGHFKSDEDRKALRESFERMFKGTSNAYKTAVLQDGATLKQFTVNAKDAQFLESRQFEIREVANWFGIPPHKLGDSSRTAYNSLEQENWAYVTESLDGWMCLIEEALTEGLLTSPQYASDNYSIEFHREALVRIDFKTRIEGQIAQVNNSLLLLDEVRSQNNMEPLPDGVGAKPRMLANVVIVGEKTANDPPQQPDPAQPDSNNQNDTNRMAAYRELLVSESARNIRRIGAQAKRAARKPDTFLDWLDDGLHQSRSSWEKSLGPIMRAIHNADDGGVADRVGRLCDLAIEDMRQRLLSASECKAAELLDSVTRTVSLAEAPLSLRVVQEAMN